MLLFFLCANLTVNYDALYDSATTALVKFTAVKDSAIHRFIALGKDPLTADTTIHYLISKFDTKSAIARHAIKDVIKGIGPSAIPVIADHLDERGTDEEARALKQALWVLEEIGDTAIVGPVSPYAADADWHVRSAALTALGKSRSRAAVPFIIPALTDTVNTVRKSAYAALSQLATEKEISYLLRGLDDEHYGVRYAALAGIRKVGVQALAAVRTELETRDKDRYFLLAALAAIGRDPLDPAIIHRVTPAERWAFYSNCEDSERLAPSLSVEDHDILLNYLEERLKD